MTMQLGFGLITCQRVPGDGRDDAALYADALDLAATAERLGFDSVWTSEYHFVDDGYLPSVLPMCAAIAARTERVAIGTGLLLAPLTPALRIAEDAAVVDLIARGRLVLGLGLGWREEEFDGLGIPLRKRVARFEESLRVLRGAWGDGLVDGLAVTPKPARPGGPPLWIGALSEPAVRRAGRLADGFMATEVNVASFAEQVRWVREELEGAGRDPDAFTFSVHLPTFAWRGDDAWGRVREHQWYIDWKYEDMEAARGARPPGAAAPPLPTHREESVRDSMVLGTPEQVAERLVALRDAAGGRLHYIARSYFPGMDPAVQRETMAVFAEEVAPLVRTP
jgi:alkanesulfonate monooxygenase SsuD/methylene tetrahydromethanopterin reductase-like flavin-dependent oxidoreductase (luciferase family)